MNLASRLEGQARPGEVLVGRSDARAGSRAPPSTRSASYGSKERSGLSRPTSFAACARAGRSARATRPWSRRTTKAAARATVAAGGTSGVGDRRASHRGAEEDDGEEARGERDLKPPAIQFDDSRDRSEAGVRRPRGTPSISRRNEAEWRAERVAERGEAEDGRGRLESRARSALHGRFFAASAWIPR